MWGPYRSLDWREVGVEWGGVEGRHHPTEGTVDGGGDGLTGHRADPVVSQRTHRSVRDAVDILH